MAFLHALEGLRTPALDWLFLLITRLGEETVFIAVILGALWCADKRAGFWMFFSWGFATGINQTLKALVKAPRPWLRENFVSAVESAKAAATGYSFPSGHTQSAFGLFATSAAFIKKTWAHILAAALIALTGFSRLYLGVHTPADVLGALGIGVVVLIVMSVLAKAEEKHPWTSLVASGLLIAASAVLILYARTGTDENMLHAAENGWKMLGASVGLAAAWELDKRVIRFSTDAPWYMQIIKFLVGIAAALGIQAGLKAPLLSLFGGSDIAHGVRYFLLTVFAGALYPLTFRFFRRGKKG